MTDRLVPASSLTLRKEIKATIVAILIAAVKPNAAMVVIVVTVLVVTVEIIMPLVYRLSALYVTMCGLSIVYNH